MVPKASSWISRLISGFGTNVFNMVPKVTFPKGFMVNYLDTSLFNMVPEVSKESETLSVLVPVCVIWFQRCANSDNQSGECFGISALIVVPKEESIVTNTLETMVPKVNDAISSSLHPC